MGRLLKSKFDSLDYYHSSNLSFCQNSAAYLTGIQVTVNTPIALESIVGPNGDKKRHEFYSKNNFYYCGLVCHRSNLESSFASVTKNKQLQQHRYIKNIPNSQWLKIVKKE